MRISKFRVVNYKSFQDSGVVTFSTGFNVVIGQNNVGKTALLEALGLKFLGKPHKSLITQPTPATPIDTKSTASVTITATGNEVREILLSIGTQFMVPVESGMTHDKASAENLLKRILANDELNFEVGFGISGNGVPGIELRRFPVYGSVYSVNPFDANGNTHFAVFQPNQTLDDFSQVHFVMSSAGNDFGLLIANILRDRIYSFRAERLNLGMHGIGANSTLQPDARNLPEVLHLLQTRNPHRFLKYNEIVRKIFPSIYQISIRPHPSGGGNLEIVTWTEDPRSQRDDLAIELTESGTGVGQVLAILYVAMNSNFPRTIIIDEPNSFLHPGASRKLLEVLREFPQHQFILSTHSPEIIAAADPENLILIKWQKPKSILEELDAAQVESVKKSLLEVGAKLSDVYGADSVLWVEGRTEEECFKLICSRLAKLNTVTTAILAVQNTGDFDRKKIGINTILAIYQKLSAGNALIPPAIGFVFDREARSDSEISDIDRRSCGQVKFLKRRTYENYLLNIDGIVAMFRAWKIDDVGQKEIIAWIEANGAKAVYFKPLEPISDINDESWLFAVNGARLLYDMTQELSNATLEYRKTIHSVWLTEWNLEHKPELLEDVKNMLSAALKT